VIVRYDVTVPDMIDVMHRANRRRAPRLGWRWKQSMLLSALLTAGFSSVIEDSNAARIFGAATFFVLAFGAMTYYQQLRVATTIKRYVVTQIGPSAPFPFEVEITAAGLLTKQLGEETRREWGNVVKITEATGGIEFDFRMGGMVFVRDRAFESPDERLEFLRLARQYAHREIVK
jgi:hypothetical protein